MIENTTSCQIVLPGDGCGSLTHSSSPPYFVGSSSECAGWAGGAQSEGGGSVLRFLPYSGRPFVWVLSALGMESLAVLGTVAAAISACFGWLNPPAAMLERVGVPIAKPYPACARFKFGDGRMGDVRFTSETPAGIAGGRGKFTSLLLGADIPATPRKGALESLERYLDFRRSCSRAG